MRLTCFLKNLGCRWEPIQEDIWLDLDLKYKLPRLLRFEQCPYCKTTRATITSPEPEETRYSSPNPATRHGSDPLPERDWVDRIPERVSSAMSKLVANGRL